MVTTVETVEQGSLLSLRSDELPMIQKLLSDKGMSWDSLDTRQMVLKLPQQYVGYIGLPRRRIVIKPKHPGLTISHILRVYYFLYSAEYSDLDTPMFDVDTGNDVNLVAMFIKELLSVVNRGIPVEYAEKTDDLNFVRGKLNVIPTKRNMALRVVNSFNCTYDDLTRDVGINRVLLAAAKKIEPVVQDRSLPNVIRQFGEVAFEQHPASIAFTKNNAYCKKAVSLAFMILNDLTLSSAGDSSSGESLLINFDRVFEDFIKKVLMEYSSLGKFSYWPEERAYGRFNTEQGAATRYYLPDLLYDYTEPYGRPTARAILDMKNKASTPFHNPDVFQMAFYSQMLHCKRVILCYPTSTDKPTVALHFDDDKFYLQRINAAFINLAGNTAKEFKENIRSFVLKIETLL